MYKQPEWFTAEIKDACLKRDFYQKKQDFRNYRIWHNKCKNLFQISKINHVERAVEDK